MVVTSSSLFAEYSVGNHSLRATGRYVDGVTDLRDVARNRDGSLSEIGWYFTTDLAYRLSLPSDEERTCTTMNIRKKITDDGDGRRV